MTDSPFNNPKIHARIAADFARVQSTSLEWNAEPPVGDFDTWIVETLAETLDAHARGYLEAADGELWLPEYHRLLRRVGSKLIENAEQRSFLSDPYSEDRMRKMAENTGAIIRRRRLLTPEQHEAEIRNEIEGLRSEVMSDAKKWNEWYCQILMRIETRFEARYRHWAAEAIDRVLRSFTPAVPSLIGQLAEQTGETAEPVSSLPACGDDEIVPDRLRLDDKAAQHDARQSVRRTRAATVGTLINELNILKPQMFEDEEEYDLLCSRYPKFLVFLIANDRKDLKRKVLSIQATTKHIRLAQELAAAHHGRQLATIQDDWKDHKPSEFRR